MLGWSIYTSSLPWRLFLCIHRHDKQIRNKSFGMTCKMAEQNKSQFMGEEISNKCPAMHSQLGDWLDHFRGLDENKVLALYLGSSWIEPWCDWPHVTYFHANKNDKWYVFLPPTGERRSDLYTPTQSEERTNEANQVKTPAWVLMSFKKQQSVVKKYIYIYMPEQTTPDNLSKFYCVPKRWRQVGL